MAIRFVCIYRIDVVYLTNIHQKPGYRKKNAGEAGCVRMGVPVDFAFNYQ
ncbi:MAG TPA: hypothetical protein VLB90_02465 [Pseudomonadales bacterium]|nr:hypothetical protein [Pseudomonadales bacterium]